MRPRSRSWFALGAIVALLFTVGTIAGSATAAPKPHKPPHTRPPAIQAPTFNPNLQLPSSDGAGEPSIRTDSTGTPYVIGPIGVPAGCKAFKVSHDGSSASFLGFPDQTVGGGDCDWALGPKETNPLAAGTSQDLAYSSLTLADITAGKSDDGGATFGPPNVAASQVALDDRMWMAADPQLNANGFADVFMTYHDLTVGDIQLVVSTDGGQTYTQNNPIINPNDVPPGQWSSSCPAASCIVAPTGIGFGNELGNIVARRTATGLTLYSIFTTPDSQSDNFGTGGENRVYEAVGTVTDNPAGGPPLISWDDYEIWHGPVGARYDGIFPVTAVDQAGNVYAIWTDKNGVEYKVSPDGKTWGCPANSTPPGGASPCTPNSTIPNPGTVNTTVFPWIDAGKGGIADVVFYGATADKAGDNLDQNAQWNVYMAQTTNAGAGWTVTQASDHVIHTGVVCTGGTNCTGNARVLLDFFQVAIDPSNGAADIAYTDDHATPGTPYLYFTRQCTGTSATTGLALTNDCVAPPPPTPPPPPPAMSSCPGPQVADFTGDAPNNFIGGDGSNMDNVDLENASFTTDAAGNLQITLHVRNLSVPPPPANVDGAYWSVYFTYGTDASGNPVQYIVQAAGTADSSTIQYTAGVDDQNQADAAANNTLITGQFNPGPDGSIVFTVPRADVGNPPNGAVLSNPWADTHVSVVPPPASGGVYYTAAADRAPDSIYGYGPSYTVGAC